MTTARALWASPAGRIGRIVVLVGIAAYLLHTVDLAGAVRQAGQANPFVVVAAVLTLTGVHVVAALNWRAIVVRLGGAPISAQSAIRAYYASQALGGITPANVGGDAYRIAALRSAGGDWTVAAAGVLVQRATSFGALAVLGAAALLALPNVTGVAEPLVAAAVGFTLVVAIPGLLLIRRAPRNASRGGRRGFAAASVIGLAGGTAFHGMSILAGYALVLAVDPRASGIGILAAVALARLSLAVPIAPSGIGVQEGALAALFILLGASPETAIAASLLGRLALLATTAIGLALVARRNTWPAPAGGPLPRTEPADVRAAR
ncbi:MAG TPA: lysylphosphatidylglycerol synthase transmembrane domain-containing protein [Candidatus Dormibacteraeota bacterium]|nr:lysylphosphatidylglycerol synthase transmembrane domain-containing protein [Candidatus Dormibacteraeota bacterium]